MTYTIWVPVKTAPLWYAIDRSVCVGLLAELVLLVDAFCAAADPPSTARASARAIVTLPMSFDFMAVLLCVLVKVVPLDDRLLQDERLSAFGYGCSALTVARARRRGAPLLRARLPDLHCRHRLLRGRFPGRGSSLSRQVVSHRVFSVWISMSRAAALRCAARNRPQSAGAGLADR